MFPRSLLLALAAVPLAGEHVAIRPVLQTNGCANAIVHEPLLVYEVRGGTLVGPVDLHLVVYSDGAARIVDVSDAEFPRAAVAHTDPDAVSDLLRDLERVGGMLGCDELGMVTDVPLHTLTMLKPGTDARAHTFSWWLPENTNGILEYRIEQYAAEAFPDFFGR